MSDRRRVPVTVVLVALGVAACARMGSPPGGPEDRDPLVIIGSRPESEASGVDSTVAVTILFAERPDRRSVMRALTVMPSADFGETIWTDSSLTLVPEFGWAADRSTIVRIDPSAHDPRGNALQSPFLLRFTTKAVPDSGVVTGRVWAGQEVGESHTVVVAAYPAHSDSGADPEQGWPGALDESLGDGRFRLTGLDTALPWLIVGIANRDQDPRPGASGEVWGSPPELVSFGEETEVEVPDFLIGTLDSIGAIAGEIAADSADLAIVVAERTGFLERGLLPGGGSFELAVPTGFLYRMAAFLDLDGDSLRGEEEPAVDLEEPIELLLTSRHEGLKFDLTGLGPAADSAAVPGIASPDSADAGEEVGE